MSATLARTPLYDWHARHGAKLVDFAGWSMPIQYESIVVEHHVPPIASAALIPFSFAPVETPRITNMRKKVRTISSTKD